MVLRWQRALRQWRDIPRENPPRYAVIAVALIMASHADPDGRHCRPAIDTIRWQAGVSKRTVVLALEWLVEHGWLEVVRKLSRRPTEYRLIIPVGAEGHPPNETPWVPTSTTGNGSVGAVVGAVVGALEHYDLRTSEERSDEEEEDVRNARSADAALAAHEEVMTMMVSDDVQAICSDIGAAVGVSLDMRLLSRPIVGAKARTGWRNGKLAAHCVDKLQRHKPGEPSVWLATVLSRVHADIVASPLMELAEVIADVCALDGASLDVQKLLVRVGLIEDYDDIPPWWKVPEDQVVRFTVAARGMLASFKTGPVSSVPSTPCEQSPSAESTPIEDMFQP